MINNQRKILGFISIGILSSLLINGCDKLSNIKLENPTQATPSIQLTVSAATSLKDVIEEIQPLYQQKQIKTNNQ